jgi:hypothetical protein
MLVLTEAAGSYLAGLLEETRSPRQVAVRIVEEAGALKSRVDEPRAGDETFNHSGRKVLVLDAKVSKALETSKLDVEQTDHGPKLILLD